MDQIKIGKFIASCRKGKNLIQKDLAEKLGITDRAISKWETGRGLPDSSIMLDLCNELGISVNELLSGEKLTIESYQENAEQNLVTMKKVDENMEHKVIIIGKLIMVGYGLLGISAVIVFGYHLYLNYTDINYNGEYFNMLLPLFVVMTFFSVISFLIINFLKNYDIIRK